MLHLYSARHRLVAMSQSSIFQTNRTIGSDKICPHFTGTQICFSEDTPVHESVQVFRKDMLSLGAPVCEGKNVLGVLRRRSVEKIVRENRYEAFGLPITSLVTRSYTEIKSENATWTDTIGKIKEEKALAVVARDRDGLVYMAVTVDVLLERLTAILDEGTLLGESS